MNHILSLRPKLGLICLLIISMQTNIINCGEKGQNKKRKAGDIGLSDGARAGAGSGDASTISSSSWSGGAGYFPGTGEPRLPIHASEFLHGAGAGGAGAGGAGAGGTNLDPADTGIMLLAILATPDRLEPSAHGAGGAGAGGAGAGGAGAGGAGTGASNKRTLFGGRKGLLAGFLKEYFNLEAVRRNQFLCNLETCEKHVINGGALSVRRHLKRCHGTIFTDASRRDPSFNEHCEKLEKNKNEARSKPKRDPKNHTN